ncbi:seipin-like [Oppia nitens]|uniref:seipin-like n=1 Tax=Oppia nitens TaxID=1686743 RepID=UPI0023DC1D9D|nr:seipin-like [Oppia nitens]
MDNNPIQSVLHYILSSIQYFFQSGLFMLFCRIFVVFVQLWISSLAIIWTSIFIYLMLYYHYIPQVWTAKDVHIQYHSTCDRSVIDSLCMIPTARVALKQGRNDDDFQRGQTYRFAIEMNLPESDVNWNQGMFMVRLKLLDQKQRTVVNVAKPTGLKYKSTPLRVIVTLLYWPLFVIGLAEEKQHIVVNLLDNFTEGSYPKVGPVTEAVIEFEARDIQIYPPTILKVGAALTGFRYFMYHHWIISAIVGIIFIASTLYFLTFMTYINHLFKSNNNNNNYNVNNIPSITNDDTDETNKDYKDNDTINDQISDELNVKANEDNNDEYREAEAKADQHEESGLTGDINDDLELSIESDVSSNSETQQIPDSSFS